MMSSTGKRGEIVEENLELDEQIRQVIAEGEAGIGDVLAAYESAEKYYLAATTASLPQDAQRTFAVDTATR